MENKAARPDYGLRVYSDISQLIANSQNPTPLVRINRLNPNRDFSIYLKLERYNPFGSVKDRIITRMLDALKVDSKTIIEPSSGNTGIALACVANALEIPVEIAIPDKIPAEKKVMLRFLGAKLREANDALCPLFPSEGARGLASALIRSPATRDSYVSPNQYENELNVLSHYETTGPEIWLQTQGKIGYFFAGLGTCGTITGVGRYIKEQNQGVKIIGVEPSLSGHRLPGMKRITELAEKYVPRILDRSVVDDVVEVTDQDAYRTAVELARGRKEFQWDRRRELYFSPPCSMPGQGKAWRWLFPLMMPSNTPVITRTTLRWSVRKRGEDMKYDLCDLVCPLSKIKAVEAIDSLRAGETAEIVLGDTDSLKSVVQELKTRGMKPEFTRENETRFVLTITR